MAQQPQFPDFDNVLTGQQQPLTWNFGAWLPAGVTLSLPVVTVTVVSGTDASPASRVISGPAITTVPYSPSQTAITLMFGGGLAGVTYLFSLTANRSDGGIARGFNHIQAVAPS